MSHDGALIKDAIDLIDRHFESLEALGNASRLLTTWEKEKNNEEKQLSKLEASFPEQLKQAQSQAKQALTTLSDLELRVVRAGRDIDAAVGQHQPLVSSLEKSSNQLHFLENAGYIVEVVSTVEKVSASIQQLCGQLASLADERVTPKLSLDDLCLKITHLYEPWQQLSKIDSFLKPLPCQNVKAHVANRLIELRKRLIQSLREVYERVYTHVLDWPTPLPEASLSSDPDTKFSQYLPVFRAIIELQANLIDTPLYLDPTFDFRTAKFWAVEWLLDRLVLSFRFSFRGTQATNRIDKPDWHCAYTLQTLREHSSYLQALTKVMHECGLPPIVDAEIAFADGMVSEIKEKLLADLVVILENRSPAEAESLFWFTLNETIDFDRALRRHLGVSPADLEGATSVFTDYPKYLQRWIGLEVKYSKEHFRDVMQSASAWERFLSAVAVAEDKERIPRNLNALLTILTTARDRSMEIRSWEDRLYFVEEVVLRLLSDYIEDLHLYEGDDYKDISSPSSLRGLCMIHNAAYHIVNITKKWNEEDFWIELETLAKQRSSSPSRASTSFEGSHRVSLLNECLESAKRLQKRISTRLVEFVNRHILTQLRPYLKKKFIITSKSTSLPLEVSSELSDALLITKQQLGQLGQHLAVRPFLKLVQHVASAQATFFFDQILLKMQFTIDGGVQFTEDVKYLLTTLEAFEHVHTATTFKILLEACRLLTLPEKDAKHVIDNTDKIVKNRQMSDSERAVALNKLSGVHYLSSTQVLYVMERRV